MPMWTDAGGPPVRERREKERVPVRVSVGRLWAVSWSGLKRCPEALLFIFLFSSFSFLFSYFFYILCILPPSKVKPILNFSKNCPLPT
jgi:hypothetical protein